MRLQLACLLGVTAVCAGCSLTLEDMKFDDAAADASQSGDSVNVTDSHGQDVPLVDSVVNDVTAHDGHHDDVALDLPNPIDIPIIGDGFADGPSTCSLACSTTAECLMCSPSGTTGFCCVSGACVRDVVCASQPDAGPDASSDVGIACPANECVLSSSNSCGNGAVCCGNSTTSSSGCGTCQMQCGVACPTGSCALGVAGSCTDGNQCCPSGTEPSCGTCAQTCTGAVDAGRGLSCGGNLCPVNEGCCNGNCVDLLNDILNCGTCGIACGSMEQCVDGTCFLQVVADF